MNNSVEVVFIAAILTIGAVFASLVIFSGDDQALPEVGDRVEAAADQVEAAPPREVPPPPVMVEDCMAIFPTAIVNLRTVSGIRHYEMSSSERLVGMPAADHKVIEFTLGTQETHLPGTDADYRTVSAAFPGCRAR